MMKNCHLCKKESSGYINSSYIKQIYRPRSNTTKIRRSIRTSCAATFSVFHALSSYAIAWPCAINDEFDGYSAVRTTTTTRLPPSMMIMVDIPLFGRVFFALACIPTG
mmetsp:Transcript_8747/g.17502  ORF Transcript_8747/g.17502 Transcript_8747/m.17502 type:complete len:108 (-) Transcript_8747:13-336(-)